MPIPEWGRVGKLTSLDANPILWLMSAENNPVPHPSVVAAREALAKRPPAPLSKILEQIEEVQAWRDKRVSAGGVKKKGA